MEEKRTSPALPPETSRPVQAGCTVQHSEACRAVLRAGAGAGAGHPRCLALLGAWAVNLSRKKYSVSALFLPSLSGNRWGERHEVTQKKQWKEKVNNNTFFGVWQTISELAEGSVS